MNNPNFKTLLLLILSMIISQVALAKNKMATLEITKMVSAHQIVNLIGGKQVQISTPLTPNLRVLFVDLKPGANWAHDGEIQVIDKTGRIVEKIPTRLPPRNLEREGISLDGRVHTGDDIAFKLNDFGGQYKVKDPSKLYAVLINGNGDQRHWNDMSFQFRTLTKIYGYSKDHIFVADSNFISTAPDLDGDGQPDIKYQSTVAGITDLLNLVKTKVTSADQVVFFVNDHGDLNANKESTLYLEDGEMTATTFSNIVNSYQVSSMLFVFEQCYSGGFVRPTVTNSRVAMAASKNTENSWSTADGNFDEFIFKVTAAFAMQNYDGTPVQSDLNGDKIISAAEAFGYAVGNDQRQESPLLESYDASGDALNISLGGMAAPRLSVGATN